MGLLMTKDCMQLCSCWYMLKHQELIYHHHEQITLTVLQKAKLDTNGKSQALPCTQTSQPHRRLTHRCLPLHRPPFYLQVIVLPLLH